MSGRTGSPRWMAPLAALLAELFLSQTPRWITD